MFEGILGKAKIFNKKEREYKTFLPPLFYLSIIKYAINIEFKPIIYFLNNIRNNLADISLLNDPKGYLSLLQRNL